MNLFFLKVAVGALALASIGMSAIAAPATKVLFTNHGVAVPVSESRGVLPVRDEENRPWIVALARDRVGSEARISLLVIDPQDGKTSQYWYPSSQNAGLAKANGDTFQVMRANNGCIYFTIGSRFLEFNLKKRQWTFDGEADGMAMSLAQGPRGAIYFATYPHSTLYRFDLTDRKLEKLGQLDPQEKYPFSLAIADDGWIYAGIGTARSNIVAFNQKTHQRTQLIDEADRKLGNGHVFASTDGHIYGRAVDAKSNPLLELENGHATPAPQNISPVYAPTGSIRFSKMLDDFPGGGKILNFSMADKTAEVELNGKTHHINFNYASNGAGITGMVAGSNGKIYGSVSHPGSLFVYDSTTDKLRSLGRIPSLGGGNIPAFTSNDSTLLAASYGNGGAFYRYDTAQPWNPDVSNPQMLKHFKEVQRPRAALLLDNGKSIFGGYGGYGVTGGGMLIYDPATHQVSAKSSEEVIPEQSPIALQRLDAKTIVGGTSIAAPGGGKVKATSAEIFLMDATTLKVTFHIAPVPGATGIFGLVVDGNGLVYGLTRESQFFIFDPKTQKVVHRGDWSKWGWTFNPGFPLWRGADGKVYGAHQFCKYRPTTRHTKWPICQQR